VLLLVTTRICLACSLGLAAGQEVLRWLPVVLVCFYLYATACRCKQFHPCPSHGQGVWLQHWMMMMVVAGSRVALQHVAAWPPGLARALLVVLPSRMLTCVVGDVMSVLPCNNVYQQQIEASLSIPANVMPFQGLQRMLQQAELQQQVASEDKRRGCGQPNLAGLASRFGPKSLGSSCS
jgi:hypothetical protein